MSIDTKRKNGVLVGATTAVLRFVEYRWQVLLIRRLSTSLYELPGGGVEKGETVEYAAKREVLEETGIQLNEEIEFLGYKENDDNHDGLNWCTMFFLAIVPPETKCKITEPKKHDDFWWYDLTSITLSNFPTASRSLARFVVELAYKEMLKKNDLYPKYCS